MKTIVGVLASHNDIYDKFKKLWIKNIKSLDDQTKKNFSFYFIYGGESEYVKDDELDWVDLYYDFQETIPNMLRKSCKFFEYINQKYTGTEEYVVLRTNLSTLFNFSKMNNWVDNLPKRMFFGGSLIDGYSGSLSRISGTNMVFTKDILKILIDNQDRFIYNENEDVVLSSIILLNLYSMLTLKTIKRLDFLQDHIMYHRCSTETDLNDLFCYRFKSDNRETDVNNMDIVMKEWNLEKFKECSFCSEGETLQILSEKFWKISDDGRPMLSN
jgi:hypothetical protein